MGDEPLVVNAVTSKASADDIIHAAAGHSAQRVKGHIQSDLIPLGGPLEQELDVVQKAVDTYAVKAEQWPTADGKLPAYGEYAPILFLAGFEKNGKLYTFYPHYIATLPKHYNEGVWLIGSNGAVSVDMDPEDY